MCHMLLLARAFIAGPLDALVSYARGGAAVGKGDTRTDHVGSDLCPLPPNAGYLYKVGAVGGGGGCACVRVCMFSFTVGETV